MLNKKPLTLTPGGVVTAAVLPAPPGLCWGGAGAGALDRLVRTWVAPGLLCSQGPARPRSWAHSNSSETTSGPSASPPTDPHNYSMQEFALKYFRKPPAL